MTKEIDWVRITKKEADAILKPLKVESHTVMICDPPITFIWDQSKPRGEGWEIYDSAVIKIVRDYSMKPPHKTRNEYYRNGGLK
jgi:hypothetical protein